MILVFAVILIVQCSSFKGPCARPTTDAFSDVNSGVCFRSRSMLLQVRRNVVHGMTSGSSPLLQDTVDSHENGFTINTRAIKRRRSCQPSESNVSARGVGMCIEGHAVPAVYLLGAPKAGTSSLYKDMSNEIVAAGFAKELYYMLENKISVKARQAWLAKFPGCGELQRPVADGTPAYFAYTDALENIVQSYGADLSQNLLFIVMLREPLARLHSHYHYYHSANWAPAKTYPNFGSFLNASFESYLKSPIASKNLYSMEGIGIPLSLYGNNLNRFFKKPFSGANLVVTTLKTYSETPQLVLKKISDKLGLECTIPEEAAVHANGNAHKIPLDREEGIDAALLERVHDLFRADTDLLSELLSSGIKQGMALVGFEGKPTQRDVHQWLVRNW